MISRIFAAARAAWAALFGPPVSPGQQYHNNLFDAAKQRLEQLASGIEAKIKKLGDTGVEALLKTFEKLGPDDIAYVNAQLGNKLSDEDALKRVEARGKANFDAKAAKAKHRALALSRVAKRFAKEVEQIIDLMGPVSRWIGQPKDTGEGEPRHETQAETKLASTVRFALLMLAIASSLLLMNYLLASGNPLFDGFSGMMLLAPASALFPYMVGQCLAAWVLMHVRAWHKDMARSIVIWTGVFLTVCFIAWVVAVALSFGIPSIIPIDGQVPDPASTKTSFIPMVLTSEILIELASSFLLRIANHDLGSQRPPAISKEMAAIIIASAMGLLAMLEETQADADAVAESITHAKADYVERLQTFLLRQRSSPAY